MSDTTWTRSLAVAAACLLVACGKSPSDATGEGFLAGIQRQAPGVRPLTAVRAAAAGQPFITPDQLWAWAELTWPDLFAGQPASFSGVSYQGKVFAGRGYPNGNYLALADNGEAWGLGPFTGQALTNFGNAQTYAEQVCSRVDCGGTRSLNLCTQPASESLRSGMNVVANLVQTDANGTREFTQESQVEPATAFNGATVTPILVTTRPATGAATRVRSYHQADDGGLVRTLGHDELGSGSTVLTRTSYAPATRNSEFSLQVGQAITRVVSGASGPLGGGTTSRSSSTTYAFEARETITVQGRAYDTCRYTERLSGTGGSTQTWYIVGSGLPARSETRSAGGTVLSRTDLKQATVNGVPVAAGQSTLDAAAADRFVTDFSYLLPICSANGPAPVAPSPAAALLRKAREWRQTARVTALQRPDRRSLAFGVTKPSDQVGACGGRMTYTSYTHSNGVTTATRRWDNYCSKDSDTGGTQVLNGDWAFVETAMPTPNGPVVQRYDAGAPGGMAIIDRDASGKVVGSQLISVVGLINTHGVPGGDPTAAAPDRLQLAEWQVRNQLTGKVYRQTGFAMTTFNTPDGGEQMSLSGRVHRSSGYFDIRTTAPVVSDRDGVYRSGSFTSTGINGDAVLITVVPGSDTLQGTMTVDGKPVTTAPRCQ